MTDTANGGASCGEGIDAQVLVEEGEEVTCTEVSPLAISWGDLDAPIAEGIRTRPLFAAIWAKRRAKRVFASTRRAVQISTRKYRSRRGR